MRNGCVYTGTVQHEILHALGFHHEQVRSDRDDFVSILTQNIQSGQLTHKNLHFPDLVHVLYNGNNSELSDYLTFLCMLASMAIL